LLYCYSKRKEGTISGLHFKARHAKTTNSISPSLSFVSFGIYLVEVQREDMMFYVASKPQYPEEIHKIRKFFQNLQHQHLLFDKMSTAKLEFFK